MCPGWMGGGMGMILASSIGILLIVLLVVLIVRLARP